MIVSCQSKLMKRARRRPEITAQGSLGRNFENHYYGLSVDYRLVVFVDFAVESTLYGAALCADNIGYLARCFTFHVEFPFTN
jgi:hypothetical protein